MLVWNQFRRLLLGTVVELLLEEGLPLDFRSIRIDFHRESEFRVPRLDNYMRFKGEVEGRLVEPLPSGQPARLLGRLRAVWPELLAVVDLPVGDRLTEEKNQVEVRVEGDRFTLRFDLVAD